MGKRLTTEEFIERARIVHGDRYGYDDVEYVNNKTKVKIKCKDHGIFEQQPDSHMSGNGCLICSRNNANLTTEEFIERARIVHGGRYGYDDVVYVNNKTKVKIKCKDHGIFEQEPNNHLSGNGCSICSGNVKSTTEEFIERARGVHGDRYGYDHIKYVDRVTKVKIRCPDHGIFEQEPNGHLSGKGCLICSGNVKSTTEEFINRAHEVHGDRYEYDDVVYVNNSTKVKIRCPDHGIFEQQPSNHLSGRGCSKCNNRGGYGNMSPEKLRAISPAYVYIVRLIGDDGEWFDKIGVTRHQPHKRFENFAHYIAVNVECKKVENMEVALNKEFDLHCDFNPVHYIPKYPFSGSKNECFELLPFKFNLEDSRKWLSGEME